MVFDKVRSEADDFFVLIRCAAQIRQQAAHFFQFNLEADLGEKFEAALMNDPDFLFVQYLEFVDPHGRLFPVNDSLKSGALNEV